MSCLIRYLYSSLAYGEADGVDYGELYAMNEKFICPDLSIYLDLDVTLALERIIKRGKPIELFEKLPFLTEVRKNYCKLAMFFKELQSVDASGDISSVQTKVWELVAPHLKTLK